jgi:hypothetical protein
MAAALTKFWPIASPLGAAEQLDELAPFHCPMPPVLATKRIAHLSYGRGLLRCRISIRPGRSKKKHG